MMHRALFAACLVGMLLVSCARLAYAAGLAASDGPLSGWGGLTWLAVVLVVGVAQVLWLEPPPREQTRSNPRA